MARRGGVVEPTHFVERPSTNEKRHRVFQKHLDIDANLSIDKSVVGTASISTENCEDINENIFSPKKAIPKPLKGERDMDAIDAGRGAFYEKFQTLGRQRQIAQYSHADPSKLTVVQDITMDDHGLTSPNRRALRRLRSRTLPENYLQAPTSKSPTKSSLFFGSIDSDEEGKTDNRLKNRSKAMNDSSRDLSPIPARRPGKHMPTMGQEVELQLSPRSKYIDLCLREGLNPRASLVLQKGTDSKQINLMHQGMGDKMGKILAVSIERMPEVEKMLLSDNNLTDTSLPSIVTSISTITSLIELDLSTNTVGRATGKAMCSYLEMQSCKIEKLSMHHCEIDDTACQLFVVSLLKENHVSKLNFLDVSNNKIGKLEKLGCDSAGITFAKWFQKKDCQLKTLNLSWNMLRGESGGALCRALKGNTSLLHLNLSYNALGREGGLALGSAILRNNTLRTLLVGNNNFDAVAAFTICAGIIENKTLKLVSLDGNPIGERGASALMMIPLVCAGRVKVTAHQCNVTIRDQACWFNFDRLCGKYVLKMDDPYEKAIAIILMHLVAYHSSLVFTKVEYDPSGKILNAAGLLKKTAEMAHWTNSMGDGAHVRTSSDPHAHHMAGSNKIKTLELGYVQMNREETLDKLQLEVVAQMKNMIAASGDITLALKLFKEVDLDDSGGIDMHELDTLMRSMGIKLTDSRLRETMANYDPDGSGAIEIADFLKFLRKIHNELESHLLDIQRIPVIATRTDPSDDTWPFGIPVIDPRRTDNKWERFVPPDVGSLAIEVSDGFVTKDVFRTLAGCDRVYITEAAKATPDPEAMDLATLRMTKIHYDDAVTICSAMVKSNKSSTQILSVLLRQMSSIDHARDIVSHVVNNDRIKQAKLKRELGQFIKPMLGRYNGYYHLDMANENDRNAVMALYSMSESVNHKRASDSPLGYGLTGDTSQKGNWSSFRNELFNGKPFVMNIDFLNDLPSMGRLEFDFSGEVKPSVGDGHVMKDSVFVKLLINLQVLRESERESTIAALRHTKNISNNTIKGDGHVVYECPWEKALEIDKYQGLFYENLGRRSESYNNSIKTEDLIRAVGPIRGGKPDRKTSIRPQSGACTNTTNIDKARSPSAIAEAMASAVATVDSAPDPSPLTSPDQGYGPSAMKVRILHNKLDAFGDVVECAEEPDDDHFIQEDDGESTVDSEATLDTLDDLDDDREEHETQGNAYYKVRKHSTSGVTDYLKIVSEDGKITPQAKMRRILDALEDLIGSFRCIYARHLATLLSCLESLPYGMVDKTPNFGNYRVEIVILLFGHVTDLHNFELVLKILNPYETSCVIARIGYLNFFNPLKPEGSWGFDLSRWDQRMMVKMMVLLETHEPGENWAVKQFRWTIDSDPVPGWMLTQPWLSEEGLPNRGILDITYYSGEGIHKNGCVPVTKFRKSLLYLTLLDENEIVEEDHHDHRIPGGYINVPGKNYGLEAMKLELELWSTYLANDPSGHFIPKKSNGGAPSAVMAPRRKKKVLNAVDGLPVGNGPSIPVFKESTVDLSGAEKHLGATYGSPTVSLPLNGSILAAHVAATSEEFSQLAPSDGAASAFLHKLHDAKTAHHGSVGLLTPLKTPLRKGSMHTPPGVTGLPTPVVTSEVKPKYNASGHLTQALDIISKKKVPDAAHLSPDMKVSASSTKLAGIDGTRNNIRPQRNNIESKANPTRRMLQLEHLAPKPIPGETTVEEEMMTPRRTHRITEQDEAVIAAAVERAATIFSPSHSNRKTIDPLDGTTKDRVKSANATGGKSLAPVRTRPASGSVHSVNNTTATTEAPKKSRVPSYLAPTGKIRNKTLAGASSVSQSVG